MLPGKSLEEIVLSARADDDSARAVLAAAAADLRRTPLRHTVRIVMRGEGAVSTPTAGRRQLARLDLRQVSGSPVIEISAQTPGWLVHALLRSGEAVGLSPLVADRRFPLLGQLVARSGTVLRQDDEETPAERNVPTVTLSGRSLLAETGAVRAAPWPLAVAAAVRRLDALAGRPLPEDQFLVVAGRVWLRRDLMWVGFLGWVLLVFRGLPGRWQGASVAQHGRQMRAYLPGLLFRLLLLAAFLLAPVFAVLLLPSAFLALLPSRVLRPVWARVLCIAAALLPLGAYLAALCYALLHRTVSLDAGFAAAPAVVLVPAALLAYALLTARAPESLARIGHSSGSDGPALSVGRR